jgi:hypothetical protein
MALAHAHEPTTPEIEIRTAKLAGLSIFFDIASIPMRDFRCLDAWRLIWNPKRSQEREYAANLLRAMREIVKDTEQPPENRGEAELLIKELLAFLSRPMVR